MASVVMDSTSDISTSTSMDSRVSDSTSNINITVNTDSVKVIEVEKESDPTVPSWAKESTKPTYTASEVGALPNTTVIPTKVSELENDAGYISFATIPTKTSDLTNDSGFITSEDVPTKVSELTNDTGYITSDAVPTKVSELSNDTGFISTETDPTVPAWAKESTKPTYTAAEVGALPDTTEVPTKVSDLTNDSGFISEETDPTVPSWAKASSKPSYTESEIPGLTDDLAAKAPLASPALTGTPTAPTVSGTTDESITIATTAFVQAVVKEKMTVGVDYKVVTELPSSGEKGIIYLVSNGGTGLNQYDEYIYNDGAFEKIGTTETDLTPYLKKDELETLTTDDIDSMWEGTYTA